MNVKYLFLLPFIFMLLPAFSFAISSGETCSFSIVIRIIFFLVAIIVFYKKFLSYLKFIYNHTPFKFLIYFYIWVLISSLFAMIFNHYSFFVFLNRAVFQLIFGCFSIFLLTGFVFPRLFSIKFLIKFIVCGYFFIFLFGFLEYLSHAFNITFLQDLNNFFVNQRYMFTGTYTMDRVKSTFAEPSWYGIYLFSNLPIIYFLSLSKYRIFRNKIINIFSKKMLIPFAWISIIMTRSPIWLIFCLVLTLVFFFKRIINLIKKNLFFVSISTIILSIICILFLKNININETYINRIIAVIGSIDGLDKLVFAEPSLASRVSSYVLTLIIFIQHPIIGVGTGATGYKIMNIINNHNIPLTAEQIGMYGRAYINNTPMNANSAIFYNTLAESGLIGFILLYVFLFKMFSKGIKILNYFKGIEKDFVKGVTYSLLSIALISFYEIYLTNVNIWFNFGLLISCMIAAYQNRYEGGKNYA